MAAELRREGNSCSIIAMHPGEVARSATHFLNLRLGVTIHIGTWQIIRFAVILKALSVSKSPFQQCFKLSAPRQTKIRVNFGRGMGRYEIYQKPSKFPRLIYTGTSMVSIGCK